MLGIFNMYTAVYTCICSLELHEHKEKTSLYWKLTVEEKSHASPGSWPCLSSMPDLMLMWTAPLPQLASRFSHVFFSLKQDKVCNIHQKHALLILFRFYKYMPNARDHPEPLPYVYMYTGRFELTSANRIFACFCRKSVIHSYQDVVCCVADVHQIAMSSAQRCLRTLRSAKTSLLLWTVSFGWLCVKCEMEIVSFASNCLCHSCFLRDVQFRFKAATAFQLLHNSTVENVAYYVTHSGTVCTMCRSA